MKTLNRVLFTGLFCLLSAPAALASVSIVGVGNYGMPAQTLVGVAATGYTSTLGFGGGVLFDIPMGQMAALEIGGLYIQEKFTADSAVFGLTAGTSTDLSFMKLEIPVALKFMLGRYFFIDFGGYFSNAIGAATQTQGSTVNTGNVTDLSQNPLNYGLIGGLGANLPLGGMVALRLEGRYHYQLSNAFNSVVTGLDTTASLKYNEVQAYAGLTFGMHGSR